jgi:hypothetical protein
MKSRLECREKKLVPATYQSSHLYWIDAAPEDAHARTTPAGAA